MPEPESTTSATPAADVTAAEQPSTDTSAQPAADGWHNLFGFLPGKKPTSTTTEAGAEDGAAKSQLASKPLAELSDAELDQLVRSDQRMQRRVQAETDRRESKRAAEKLEQDRRDREAAIERKLDPNSPDFDPYAGAEEQAALKAAEASSEQFTTFLQDIGKQHDTVTLDVIVEALPAAERDRIFKLEGAGVGLDGRKLIVTEGLKALEKHWKAEGQRAAEDRLRGDPIFRKRVFAEHRDQVDEPELLPANGAVQNGDPFMEQIFSDYKRAKGRRS